MHDATSRASDSGAVRRMRRKHDTFERLGTTAIQRDAVDAGSTCALWLMPCGLALAATITVTTVADENGTGSDCFLREAIASANGDPQVCAHPRVSGVDQRGFGRPGGGHTPCSIGVYEAGGFSPEPCVGDCDGTGSVTADELITLVSIALGTARASACPHGVPSGADVDVALIIEAVNVALNGCGA